MMRSGRKLKLWKFLILEVEEELCRNDQEDFGLISFLVGEVDRKLLRINRLTVL